MLTNHFPEGSYYPTQEDLMANGGKYYSQKQLVNGYPDILKKSLIMGHYNVKLITHLNPNVKVIAFFRNPISRILSHVKHIIKLDPKFKGADPNEVIFKNQSLLFNVQTSMLGFSRKDKNIDIVKKRIDQLDGIGIVEEFDNSIEMFNQINKFSLETIPIYNKSSINIISDLDEKTLSLICRKIKFEIVLYNYAYDKFEKQKKCS